jgi:hypothetical protein
MTELHKNGLFYYCDKKYAPRHKCREQNLFQIDASTSSSYNKNPLDEVSYQEAAQPSDLVKDPVVTPMESMESVISLHALSGI